MTAVTLCLASLLAGGAPPETPKPVDYEKELNDKLSKGITSENNSNALLWKVFGPKPEGGNMPPEFFKRLGIDEPPEQGDYFIGLHKFMKDHLQLDQEEFDGVYKQQGWASSRPWAAKDYPFIAAWLKQNEKPLNLVHEAVKREHYYNPLVSRKTETDPGSLIAVLLPSVQKCRELASALTARAMLRLQEGKPDDAWADLQACHRLSRHLSHGGTLIEMLVAIAIEAIVSNSELAYLENANLTSKQMLEKLKDLQSLPPRSSVARKIDVGERHMYLDSLKLLRRGGVGMLDGLPGGDSGLKLTPEEEKALRDFDWTPAEENGNKWYDRMVAALKKPNRAERNRELDAIEADLKKLKEASTAEIEGLRKKVNDKDAGKAVVKIISDVLIGLLAPAIRKVQEAGDRADQIQANLHVAFALAAYHRDNGNYPAKLDDLAPKYLATVPGDVFSGKGLIYKPEAKGYLFYSVGANGMDDDGRWYDDEPRGDDPRVRMPLPPLKKE